MKNKCRTYSAQGAITQCRSNHNHCNYPLSNVSGFESVAGKGIMCFRYKDTQWRSEAGIKSTKRLPVTRSCDKPYTIGNAAAWDDLQDLAFQLEVEVFVQWYRSSHCSQLSYKGHVPV